MNEFRSSDCGRQVCELLDRLDFLVIDGLRHGFFEISLSCQKVTGGKRLLVIHAGKSYKFTIPEDELPR